MQKMGSKMSSLARGIGAASLLFSQSVQSDEALIQPGTSLGQFPTSSIPALQDTLATQLISDITPAPSLLPSNTFRWLLVKTDSGLALTLPENYAGTIQHFGQQEKFFVRFDTNTGLPEISFDLTTWQPYTSGTPVNISREEQTTILSISSDLQTLNTLKEEQGALSADLAAQQAHLARTQTELGELQTDLALTDYDLAATEGDIADQQLTKNTLETALKPEAQLRADTHPIVQNTALDDTIKTNLTQTALNTYDNYQAPPEGPGKPLLMASAMFAPLSVFVPPTAAEVQGTITLLSQELSRLQTQINSVNSQITVKQNEITATENSIAMKQAALDPLEAQLQQYLIDYNYWDGEVTRLRGLRDAAKTEMESIKTSYANNRTRLMNEGGRSDVPSDLTASDISSQISSLKTRIMNEHNTIAIAPNTWPNDVTTSGKTDLKSTTTVRLDSSYYFFTDFYSSAKSYPAKLETWFKPTGSSSAAKGSTIYTVNSQNHLASILSNTAKPKIEKLCDYAFADKVLETTKDDYLTEKNEYETYKTQAGDATWIFLAARDNINAAKPLIDQYKAELTALNAQKSTLTTQKTDLETLKNTKATLQTLYNRVKTILDQLQQHVASHGTVTQEIATLVQLAQQLEAEIANLEILIADVSSDAEALNNIVGSLSDDITTINTTLTATEQALLATLSSIATVIPKDSFSRNGTILTPSSEALRYFSDGFRTGKNARTLAGLPVKWMIQYYHDGTNDLSLNIYPASVLVQYTLNGRAYCTDGQKINNFTHKELMNGDLEIIITRLNACIALLNQYPAGSNEGIENFLSALKIEIAKLEASKSTNATIRNHVTAVNDFTEKTLLQGGSYALFEQLVAKNPAFSLKIEEMVELMAQKGNIGDGADARSDLRHMVTTIFARAFAERLTFSGTDGLDIYAHWEQEALSFISGLGGTATLDNEFDMNADWSIDAHGNKYKFGLYHPGDIGNYNPPATLFMMYSPDGINTQVLGPVSVSSGEEADAMKARWKEELLKMKQGDTIKYSGGTYDIFRGWDNEGGYSYWGQSSKNGIQRSATFSGNMNIVVGSAKAFLESTNITSNLSSNEAFYRSLFGLPYDYFAQNAQTTLSSLIQLSDQNLSLALGQILDYSINVTVWNGHQKEVAKVIVSLSGIIGFPADQVKEFQRNALQQLDTLGANFEQDIINDTMTAGRTGNIEEIRTVVVLQKLSQLFMKKTSEMNAMNNASKLNAAEQLALGAYGISLAGYQTGMKRLYFAIEESAGESNLKRNIELLKLCSGDTTLDPGGYVKFLDKRIDLSDMGNILLGYNAKQLGLTLEETVFGAFVAQSGIDIGDGVKDLYERFLKNTLTFDVLIKQLENTRSEITSGENNDQIHYEKGYFLVTPSPINLLKL